MNLKDYKAIDYVSLYWKYVTKKFLIALIILYIFKAMAENNVISNAQVGVLSKTFVDTLFTTVVLGAVILSIIMLVLSIAYRFREPLESNNFFRYFVVYSIVGCSIFGDLKLDERELYIGLIVSLSIRILFKIIKKRSEINTKTMED